MQTAPVPEKVRVSWPRFSRFRALHQQRTVEQTWALMKTRTSIGEESVKYETQNTTSQDSSDMR
jgi:hypothetical protein